MMIFVDCKVKSPYPVKTQNGGSVMLALMAKKTKAKVYPRPAGTKDVFARLSADVVDKLDTLVNEMKPATSRSAVIALMIEQYVEERWAQREAKGEK